MELKTIIIVLAIYIAVRIFVKSRQSNSEPIMSHGKVTQIDNDVIFKALVSSGPVVVDFFATWCGPCKAVAPVVGKLSEQHENVRFLQVDVDKLQGVARELQVNAMPTFVLFKNGQEAGRVVGGDMKKLEAEIKKLSE